MDTMTEEDITKLRALAEAATPGPWIAEVDAFDHEEISAVVADAKTNLLFTSGCDVSMHHSNDAWSTEDSRLRDAQWEKAKASQAMRDATYIAACSPDVVRGLLDRLRDAQDEISRLGRQLSVCATEDVDRGNSEGSGGWTPGGL